MNNELDYFPPLYLVIHFFKTHFCLLLRKAASARPTGRLARGLKPPAFSRILFQLSVQSASFYATSFHLVVVYFVHGCRAEQHTNVPAIFKRLQFAKAKRAECPKDFLKKRITCTRAMALMHVR
jgi:hypothetical protein